MEPNEYVEGSEYSWYLLKSMLISFYLFDCISYMYHVLVMKDNTHTHTHIYIYIYMRLHQYGVLNLTVSVFL